MKKIILLSILFALCSNSFSQRKAKDVKDPALLKKALHYRHAANTLFWGGMTLVVTGGVISLSQGIDFSTTGDKQIHKTAGVIASIGAGLIVTSLPFFVIYHSKKNDALSVSTGNQMVPVVQGSSFTKIIAPSITLKFSL